MGGPKSNGSVGAGGGGGAAGPAPVTSPEPVTTSGSMTQGMRDAEEFQYHIDEGDRVVEDDLTPLAGMIRSESTFTVSQWDENEIVVRPQNPNASGSPAVTASQVGSALGISLSRRAPSIGGQAVSEEFYGRLSNMLLRLTEDGGRGNVIVEAVRY